MSDSLTEADLRQLETRKLPALQDPEVSAPSPEVVARAKEIRDGKPATLSKFDEVTKTAFMAHVLHGASFKKTYSGLGSTLSVTFKVLTAKEVEKVNMQCFLDETDNPSTYKAGNRELRNSIYSMCLAVDLLSFGSRIFEHPEFSCSSGTEFRTELNTFLSLIPSSVYDVFRAKYAEFTVLVNSLLTEGESESFWVTPS